MSTEELNASISLTYGTSPTGTMTTETHRLKAKASTIAAAIERFEGPAWKAQLLWSSRYLSSLKYSLPITTLSPAQVHTIQNRPIRAILGSLGVNRMFPRDVAHGPPSHGGLGLPHLLTIQGTSQIELLTGHIRQNDVNGKLTLACLDTAQLIAGISEPLLEFPSRSYPHLKDPWLDSHRSFLTDCDAKLVISPAWTPTLHRTHDRLIMEVAVRTTSPIDLRHINQCRLYLKVQRLSDLCNGAGTELLPYALQQTYPRHNVQSNLTWPRQGEPSPRAWATWKRTLRRLFLADRSGSLTSLALSNPLGPWTIDTSSADTSWPYYYDDTTKLAYERILDDYWPMLRVRTRRRDHYQFSNDYPDNTNPRTFLPTTATPATLTTRTTNSVSLSVSTTSIRQTVNQYTSTALTTVTALARSSTIPSKIPVTHLPPWEQPFLRHNQRSPTGPSWPPASLPEITVGLASKQDGDTTLYSWYIPFAGEPLLSGSGKLPESPTSFPPRALGTPVALYSALRCLQLLISSTLWSTIKTVPAV